MKTRAKRWVLVVSWMLLLALAPLGGRAAWAQDAPSLLQESYEQEAMGRVQDALATLERIPGASQGYVFHLRRGWLLYLVGRHADAVPAYERAIAAAPASIEARLGVMLPLMAQRRWIDADRQGREVLKRDAVNYLASSRSAFCAYNLGRWADALPLYRKMVEHYPSDVEMRAGLGWTLLKLGNGAEAARAFREVLELAPKHASAKEGLRTLGVP